MTTTTASSSSGGFFESISLFSPRLQRATATSTPTEAQQQAKSSSSSSSRSLYKTEYSRFYYSTRNDSRRLFEQSLDVYKPIIIEENGSKTMQDEDKDDKDDMPDVVVALVVGSGWMGHRAMVYTATSWWNSAGPKSMAQLGYVCVCIRHRGAFPCLTFPTCWSFVKYTAIACFIVVALLLSFVFLLAVLLTEYAAAFGTDGASTNITSFLSTLLPVQEDNSCSSSSYWRTAQSILQQAVITAAADHFSGSNCNNSNNPFWFQGTAAALCLFLAIWTSFIWMRRGSATLDDMLEDVAEAMVWIQNNPQHLVVRARGGGGPLRQQQHQQQDGHQDNDDTTTDSSRRRSSLLLLGGYSSGGHVAATLLQRPDIWQRHGLPLPQECLHGAVFISGVMAVHVDENDDNDKMAANNHNRIGIALTNLVKYMAFGGGGGDAQQQQQQQNDDDEDNNKAFLPSPLHNVSNSPRIPHLLIGCAHELPFGLPWLDIFFRSQDYTRQLQQTLNVPARYIELPSSRNMNLNNHWTILASHDLKQALVHGFAWLAEQQLELEQDENKNDDMKKVKVMGQQEEDDENFSQLPDALLDDSSYSEE